MVKYSIGKSSLLVIPFVAGALSGTLLCTLLFIQVERRRRKQQQQEEDNDDDDGKRSSTTMAIEKKKKKKEYFQDLFLKKLVKRYIMDETDPKMKVQRYKELLFLAGNNNSDIGEVDDGIRKQQQEQQQQQEQETSVVVLCGRFMKGRKEEDFEILSEEPGKLLSWVCSEDMLLNVLCTTTTTNPVEALISVGFRTKYIKERLNDGTQFKLVIFPTTTITTTTTASHDDTTTTTTTASNDDTTTTTTTTVTTTMTAEVVTWTNLWKLIQVAYGDDIDQALEPFKESIPKLPVSDTVGYEFVEGIEITRIGDLPVNEKHAHQNFMSAEKFLKIPYEQRTIYHARAFLHHSVGCNHRFLGNGLSPDGHVEIMTLNKRLEDIPGAELIDLVVTEEDLNEAIARHGLM